MKDNVKNILGNINKKYGKGSIYILGEQEVEKVPAISTGSIGLDIALGVGGFPFGRMIEIMGWESSGKSTLCIHATANAQKAGHEVAYIDTEHAFDPDYAEKLGVNINDLIFSQPDSGEQALNIVEDIVKSNEVKLIIVDSVATLTPEAELSGEMGDSKMGLHARLMAQATRKLVHLVKKNDICLIWINQYRHKIGVVYGSPVVTTGGNSLKFYASQRIEISRTGSNKTGDEVTSNKIKCKVIKNKVAPPFKQAEFEIEFGKGIDRMKELIDLAVEFGIIKKAGSWFSLNDEQGTKLGQGVDNVKQLFLDNPEMCKAEVEDKVFEIINSKK